jgi:hypothetical protein
MLQMHELTENDMLVMNFYVQLKNTYLAKKTTYVSCVQSSAKNTFQITVHLIHILQIRKTKWERESIYIFMLHMNIYIHVTYEYIYSCYIWIYIYSCYVYIYIMFVIVSLRKPLLGHFLFPINPGSHGCDMKFILISANALNFENNYLVIYLDFRNEKS